MRNDGPGFFSPSRLEVAENAEQKGCEVGGEEAAASWKQFGRPKTSMRVMSLKGEGGEEGGREERVEIGKQAEGEGKGGQTGKGEIG